MSRRRLSLDRIGIALLVVFAVAVTIWVLTKSPDDQGQGEEAEATLAHVHALGVNPADDTLFAAIHYGLFRIDGDGVAMRVSDSFQDTMGFTVVGPDHFFSSGHPDLPGRRASQPALLGLLESTDAGTSWVALSLAGEADFHGLSFVGGTTYGWDATSGAFMVSTDRLTWERRSTVEMWLLSSTSQSNRVWVATHGDMTTTIRRSDDDGVSWSVVYQEASALAS